MIDTANQETRQAPWRSVITGLGGVSTSRFLPGVYQSQGMKQRALPELYFFLESAMCDGRPGEWNNSDVAGSSGEELG